MYGSSKALLSLSFVILILGRLPYPLTSGVVSGEERLALATTTIIWDMARNVAGDLWRVEAVVKPGTDPHTYEPTPQDMVLAAQSRLILYNGQSIDQWIARLLSASSKAHVVMVTEGLEQFTVKVPDGPYKGMKDPHIWMDVKLAVKFVDRIKDAFIEVDPVNSKVYSDNARSYVEDLMRLDGWIRDQVSKLEPSRRLLFTQENAFQYFARSYGFRVVGYFYSIVTEIEPSPLDVAQVVEKVRDSGLCVFFVETTLSPRMMQVVTKELGGRLGGKLYADSIGPPGSGAESYVQMMRRNVEVMVEELSKWC